ncbi:MAG TPA: PDZ domain-containing protein [Gemmatimonadaceae bacterium]|nr:PDZ domain-containing protein [Gemmatimonadaceae bacterium]
MHRRTTTRWRQGWWHAALGVTAGVALGAPAVAGAQQRPRTPAPPTATEVRTQLDDLEREREAVAVQLRRLAETLSNRSLEPALNDSLVWLVRRYTELGTRAALLGARLRVGETELRMRRRAPARQAPTGWLGLNVETLWNGDVQPNGRVLMSVEYPKVVSVEPGSPAARAGLAAGDRLIAIAGTDLRRQAFDLRAALQPGRVLPVRILRDGHVREVQVTITQRPATFMPGVTVSSTFDTGARAGDQGGRVRVPVAPGVTALPSGGVVVRRGAPAPEGSRLLSPSPVIFYSSPNVVTVAGAEVLRLSPELRATLEVPHGVLVVQVARSSPADRSGLRQGDVLLRANGVTLSSPLVFQQVVAAAVQADSGVRVELVRGKRTRTLQLRW